MGFDPVILAVSEQIECSVYDTCVAGDAIGWDGTNWVRADADASPPVRAEFFAIHRCWAAGDTIKVARKIVLFDADAPYTKGALQFLSTTPGKHSETNPVAAVAAVQCLGKALSTDTVYLDSQLGHLTVPFNVAGAAAATAANYGYVFVADRNWRLISAREVHRSAGNDASAVTLDVEKLASGTAQDSGVSMLAGTFDLKAAAATPQAKAPSATVANARLKPGDAVALKDAGTLTNVADVAGTLQFVEDL